MYLLTLPNANFNFLEKNGSGNTVLHLAIKTNMLKFVKMLLMKVPYLSSMDIDDNSLEANDHNYFNLKLLKDLSTITNNKGMSSLLAAVDQGNF